MNTIELDAKMILRLLREEHLMKPGESDGFTLDINGTQWEMKLKRESEVYLPFKYSLTGRCTEPPQSPETPQTIKHTTRTDKPRETARKEPRRTISKMERVHARQKLGVQGYSMFADASVILAAINVPPIRGDCIISVFQRAKPPNCASREKINIL